MPPVRRRSAVLQPVQGVKLGDEVTKQIRDAVMSGAYQSGEKLAIEKLAGELGVSTMPVREALLALASEGILEISPRRGFRVAMLARRDIEDIFYVHAFLAGVLAERAARVIDEATLKRLWRIREKVDALRGSGDSDDRRQKIEFLNYSFHRTVNGLVDAPRLHWFLDAASKYVPRHMYETLDGWTQLTVDDHPHIIEALERRDESASRTRTEEHVLHAGKLVIDNLEAHGFFDNSPAAPALPEPESTGIW